MHLFQLKLNPKDSLAQCVKLLRRFEPSLSIQEIRHRIEADDFVIQADLTAYDPEDPSEGPDRKQVFRSMIKALCQAGAEVRIYDNGTSCTLDFLDQWMDTLDQIEEAVTIEIERELPLERNEE